MNNNTKDPNSKTLSQATGTVKGTAEQGALKTIHRSYNKLNGYEAMLHIINRFRFVLYPFILLSIAGSSFSFYNDFMKSFPMLSDTANLTLAIFFSVMLEIVRDGALIALFNMKMNKPSRYLVIFIFLAVTTYLFSSHLKAIDVIEESAIAYTLKNQDEKDIEVANPKYAQAQTELKDLDSDLVTAKKDLVELKGVHKEQLDLSVNAKYQANREKASLQVPIAKQDIADKEADIKKLKEEIKSKRSFITGEKESNNQDIEDSQKLISNILLATLLLIESLAMLGAVIKFINADNAKKEIAKHSEIVEEYIEISEQMKQDNEELTKNLSNTVKTQSESNQSIMNLVTDDLKQSSQQNIEFIKAIAQNKNEMMIQMNEMLTMMSTLGNQSFSFNQQQPKAQLQETSPKPIKKIGFQAISETELVKALYQDGKVNKEKKLTPKSQIINQNNRREDERMRNLYNRLQEADVIEFKPSKGYYAVADYQTALSVVGGGV